MFRPILLIGLCVFVTSCATGLFKEQESIRNHYLKGNYSKALDTLDKSKLKEDKSNELLYLMIKGRLEFLLGDYHKAAHTFNTANELVDRLYTQSIKEILLSGVVDENVKTFYGRPYERSLLYYYQGISHILLAQDPSLTADERRQALSRAKAVMLAWDTFMQDLARSSRDKTIFDESMSARLMAAKVHETINSRSDMQVALQLYHDALTLLKERGGVYASFYDDYEKYLSAKLSREKIELNAEKLSMTYNQLKDFLHLKVLTLTKKLRSSTDLKREISRLSPSEEVLKTLGNQTEGNITLLFEDEALTAIRPHKVKINFNTLLKRTDDPELKRQMKTMGALTLGASQVDGVLMFELLSELGFEFEVVEIPVPLRAKDFYAEVRSKDEEAQEGESRFHRLIAAVPIGDMAYAMEKERSQNYVAKKGIRIALKYLIAIAAAQKQYEVMKKNGSESGARLFSLGQYYLSTRLIAQTEKADTRQWSILPGNIYMAELGLSPGEYHVRFCEQSEHEVEKKCSDRWRELKVKNTEKAIFSFTP